MTEGTSKDAQWQKLFGYALGYQAAWIIDVGLRAGLFQAIREIEPVSEESLAERLQYAQRYVQVWCRGAFAFELLDWDTAGYRLAPHMATLLLDAADPQFLGGRIQFITALHEDFRAFPGHLRSGEPWPRSAHDPWLLEALKNMTRPDATMITEWAIPALPEVQRRLEQGGTILDIGAGGGFAAMHYANRYPRSRVIGLEPDAASAELARRSVADAAVQDRVAILEADANALAQTETYDLVILNVALHETGGPPEYRNVLTRARRALRQGGAAVVSELPYPDAPAEYRQKPVFRMMAGTQFHEALVGCGAITHGQLRALLEGAGFDHVRDLDQPLVTRVVMLGEK